MFLSHLSIQLVALGVYCFLWFLIDGLCDYNMEIWLIYHYICCSNKKLQNHRRIKNWQQSKITRKNRVWFCFIFFYLLSLCLVARFLCEFCFFLVLQISSYSACMAIRVSSMTIFVVTALHLFCTTLLLPVIYANVCAARVRINADVCEWLLCAVPCVIRVQHPKKGIKIFCYYFLGFFVCYFV